MFYEYFFIALVFGPIILFGLSCFAKVFKLDKKLKKQIPSKTSINPEEINSTRYVLFALLAFTIVSSLAISHFGIFNSERDFLTALGITPGRSSIEQWGTIGDYMGGILNPILSFIAILLLLKTIQLQSKELRQSTIELGESSKALKFQQRIMEQQALESYVFNGLKLVTSIRESNEYLSGEYINHLRDTLISDIYSKVKNATRNEYSTYKERERNDRLFSILFEKHRKDYLVKLRITERVAIVHQLIDYFCSVNGLDYEKEKIKFPILKFLNQICLILYVIESKKYSITEFEKKNYIETVLYQLTENENFLLFYYSLYFFNQELSINPLSYEDIRSFFSLHKIIDLNDLRFVQRHKFWFENGFRSFRKEKNTHLPPDKNSFFEKKCWLEGFQAGYLKLNTQKSMEGCLSDCIEDSKLRIELVSYIEAGLYSEELVFYHEIGFDIDKEPMKEI